jgi:hypothetical protein
MSPLKKTLKPVETVELPHLKTPETVETPLPKRSKCLPYPGKTVDMIHPLARLPSPIKPYAA